MIELFVEDYCHNCPDFDPYISKTKMKCDRECYWTNTVITCKHAERCKEIKNYLEKQFGNMSRGD